MPDITDIQFKRKKSGSTYNSILKVAEPLYEEATKRLYVGDGKSVLSALDYIGKRAEISTDVSTTINGKKISDIFESDGITVKKAKGSIKNSDGTYSSLSNDSNNVLKVDDTLIIEKKEELLAAPVTINRSSEYQTVNLTKSINVGDIIEVEIRSVGTGIDNFNSRYRFIYRTLSTSDPYKYDFNSFYFVGNEGDGIRFQYFSIKTFGEKAMQFHSIVQNTLNVQNEKAYLSPDLLGYSYTVQHIYRIIS